MANLVGEVESSALRLDFDPLLMLQFRGSVVTTGSGLLAYREPDDTLGFTALAGEILADAQTGKNGRHGLVGLLRQPVFGRLTGYNDVSDAERLRHEPAMRWVVRPRQARCSASRRNACGRHAPVCADRPVSAMAAPSPYRWPKSPFYNICPTNICPKNPEADYRTMTAAASRDSTRR